MHEISIGKRILTFDGRVLEVFGGTEVSVRIHVAQLKVRQVPMPGGKLTVDINLEGRKKSLELFTVSEEERPAFESFMAEVLAAREAPRDDGRFRG